MNRENDKVLNVDKSVKNQDFFQDNNAIKIKLTTTRTKSRNLVFNIAYVGIKKEDSYNKILFLMFIFC